MSSLLALEFPIFLAVLGTAAVLDVRHNLIPNRLTTAVLVLGLLFGAAQGSLGASVAGAGLALLVVLPFFVAGAIGGGDGKLFMGIGAFLGPMGLLSAAVYAGVGGGLMALAQAIRKGVFLPVLLRTRDLLLFLVTFGRHGRRPQQASAPVTIPYGVALAAGAVAAWFVPLLEGGLR